MKKRYVKQPLYVLISVWFLLLLFPAGTTICGAQELPEVLEQRSELEKRADELYESMSFSSLLRQAGDALKETFYPSLQTLAGLLALTLICAVSHSFSFPFGGNDIGGYISALCFSGYTFAILQGLCRALTSYIDTLKNIMTVITPTLIAASAADGVFTARAGYSGMSAALLAVEYLVNNLVLPCVKLLMVLSIAGTVSEPAAELRGISSSIRTFAVFTVTLSMTAIVTVMHFQHIIARAADSVGLRALRFASVSLIPLVGGLVGESVKTVAEALRAVKGLTGAAGGAAVLSAFLPPVTAIFVFKGEILICSCLARTLGCRREAAFLTETNGILNLLNAAVLAATIGFSAIICLVADAV